MGSNAGTTPVGRGGGNSEGSLGKKGRGEGRRVGVSVEGLSASRRCSKRRKIPKRKDVGSETWEVKKVLSYHRVRGGNNKKKLKLEAGCKALPQGGGEAPPGRLYISR